MKRIPTKNRKSPTRTLTIKVGVGLYQRLKLAGASFYASPDEMAETILAVDDIEGYWTQKDMRELILSNIGKKH